MIGNAYFFEPIEHIGGIETFIYNLCEKYDYDIVIYYMHGDLERINKIREIADVREYRKGEIIECERAFFQYNYKDFIDYVKAEKRIYVVHADFMVLQGLIVPNCELFDEIIAVSETSANSFEKRSGYKCRNVGMPLVQKDKKPPLFILVAQRMSSEKGFERLKKLFEELDKDEIVDYFCLVLTHNGIGIERIESPNVTYCKAMMDCSSLITACDLFVSLTDTESFGLSVEEKLMSNTGKLLVTPCEAYKGRINKDNAIVLNFDMSNLDDVIRKVRELYLSKEKVKTRNYKPKEDKWDSVLSHTPKKYKGVVKYLVEATNVYTLKNVYDQVLKCVPKEHTQFIVDEQRLQKLLNYRLGRLVNVIEEIDSGKSRQNIQN